VQARLVYRSITWNYILSFFLKRRNCSRLIFQKLFVLTNINLKRISINKADTLTKCIKPTFLFFLLLILHLILRFAWVIRLTDVWTIHLWALIYINFHSIVRCWLFIHLPFNLLQIFRLLLETFQAIVSFNSFLKFRQINLLLAWYQIYLSEASLWL
jgi:hypothetical protein